MVLASLMGSAALFRATQNMALTTFSLLGRDQLGLGTGALGALGAVAGLTLVAVTVVGTARVPAQRAAAAIVVASLLLAGSLVAFAAAKSIPVFVLAVVLLGAAGGLGLPVFINAVQAAAGRDHERAVSLYTVALSASLAVGPLVETLVLDRSGQSERAPFLAFLIFPLLVAVFVSGQARRDRSTAPVAPTLREATPRRRWRRALIASRGGRMALAAQLLYAVPFAGITVFGALIGRSAFGTSPSDTQLAFSCFFATSLASRALVAWRAPVTRKTTVFWVSAGLTTAGLVVLGVGHGLALFLVAMAVLGVPHGTIFPVALALVADSTPTASLPRANADLLGASNLTGIVIPPVLGILIPTFGYQGTTLLILIPVVAFTAMLLSTSVRKRALVT